MDLSDPCDGRFSQVQTRRAASMTTRPLEYTSIPAAPRSPVCFDRASPGTWNKLRFSSASLHCRVKFDVVAEMLPHLSLLLEHDVHQQCHEEDVAGPSVVVLVGMIIEAKRLNMHRSIRFNDYESSARRWPVAPRRRSPRIAHVRTRDALCSMC